MQCSLIPFFAGADLLTFKVFQRTGGIIYQVNSSRLGDAWMYSARISAWSRRYVVNASLD